MVACHRLKKTTGATHSSLIVRFTNRRIRSEVLAVKKILASPELRKDNIFINEHSAQHISFTLHSGETSSTRKEAWKRLDEEWSTVRKVNYRSGRQAFAYKLSGGTFKI